MTYCLVMDGHLSLGVWDDAAQVVCLHNVLLVGMYNSITPAVTLSVKA